GSSERAEERRLPARGGPMDQEELLLRRAPGERVPDGPLDVLPELLVGQATREEVVPDRVPGARLVRRPRDLGQEVLAPVRPQVERPELEGAVRAIEHEGIRIELARLHGHLALRKGEHPAETGLALRSRRPGPEAPAGVLVRLPGSFVIDGARRLLGEAHDAVARIAPPVSTRPDEPVSPLVAVADVGAMPAGAPDRPA